MNDIDAIYQKLRSYCNRAERCSQEVYAWLEKREIEGEEADHLVQRLIDCRLLDEARFVRAFSSDKLRFSYWGYYKIRQALFQKEIPSYLVESILPEVMREEDEDGILRTLVLRRLGQVGADELSQEERQKQIHYLMNKGFAYEKVINTIEEVLG